MLKVAPFADDCPRFRSLEISASEPRIMIRGRCGGGNREEYEKEIEAFTRNQGFEYERDCRGDDTYAIFVFTVDSKLWNEYMEHNMNKIQDTKHDGHECDCEDNGVWQKKQNDIKLHETSKKEEGIKLNEGM